MMPTRAARVCRCGLRIADGATCPCQRGRKSSADKQRPTASARGYGTKWGRERAEYLLDHPWCTRCLTRGIRTAATVINHKIPHKGEPRLFWNRRNWEAVCPPCHNSLIQSEERRAWISKEAQHRRMPPDLRPSLIPLTIVCGPPGAGKASYVRQHAGRADLVVDLDVIKAELSGARLYQAGPEWTGPALLERNRMLRSLAERTWHLRAWFIVGAPTHDEREQWRRLLGAERVELIKPPIETCVANILRDHRRIGHRERMVKLTQDWFARFTDAPGGRVGGLELSAQTGAPDRARKTLQLGDFRRAAS